MSADSPDLASTPPAPPKVTTVALRYHGEGGQLFGLILVNGILTILTLGFYSFWAKNKVRTFHYSHTEMDGDRFAYHGTGGELLSGALKAGMVMFLLGVLLTIGTMVAGSANSDEPPVWFVFAFYGAIGLLIPIAVNGARRYRLSRSSWRGIRFAYHGRWKEYLGLVVSGTFLSIVTLGLYIPRFQNQKQEYLVTHTRFGSEPFLYTGDGRELFGEYIKAFLLGIPTLGLSWIWYSAFKHRYFWSHTAMRGARFRSTVTGGDLLSLTLVNILLLVFTAGLAFAWVQTRTHAFWCEQLSLKGTVDWASIEQRAQRSDSTAEGLADALDVDIGIG